MHQRVTIHPVSVALSMPARYVALWWLLLVAVASGAMAQERSAGNPQGNRTVPVRTEAQWLQAIQAAAQRVNFAGTIVYQQGGTMRASRIVHLWDGSSSHERLQMLDGKPREFIRKDREVQCLIPESRRVLIERTVPGDSFPSLGGGAPREILENYNIKLEGSDRVAGYECQILLLQPRDAMRYGHRLCVEPVTALLLRSQTLDERLEPIDQMAFTDVRINERIDRALLKPSWSTDGWRVDRSEHQSADLAKMGWNIVLPAGFRKLREVERRMGGAHGNRQALQTVLTDGLATMSVFIELGGGSQLSNDLTHNHGSLSGYTRRVGDALVTVVGEIPPATAKTVAQGVTNSAPAAAAPPNPERQPR